MVRKPLHPGFNLRSILWTGRKCSCRSRTNVVICTALFY